MCNSWMNHPCFYLFPDSFLHPITQLFIVVQSHSQNEQFTSPQKRILSCNPYSFFHNGTFQITGFGGVHQWGLGVTSACVHILNFHTLGDRLCDGNDSKTLMSDSWRFCLLFLGPGDATSTQHVHFLQKTKTKHTHTL